MRIDEPEQSLISALKIRSPFAHTSCDLSSTRHSAHGLATPVVVFDRSHLDREFFRDGIVVIFSDAVMGLPRSWIELDPSFAFLQEFALQDLLLKAIRDQSRDDPAIDSTGDSQRSSHVQEIQINSENCEISFEAVPPDGRYYRRCALLFEKADIPFAVAFFEKLGPRVILKNGFTEALRSCL